MESLLLENGSSYGVEFKPIFLTPDSGIAVISSSVFNDKEYGNRNPFPSGNVDGPAEVTRSVATLSDTFAGFIIGYFKGSRCINSFIASPYDA